MGSLHGAQTTSTTATHPRRTQHRARMATPSGHRHPHQLPSRTPRKPRSTQPCTARNPIRPARQQSIHNHPQQPRDHLPFPPLDCCSFDVFDALPLTSRFCRCRRATPLATTVQLVPKQGSYAGRGGPLDRAGARLTTNTRIIDLNIDHVDTQDDRRIEVIANGLPLWGGAQLAVDASLVSPLTRAAQPRMRGGQYRGTALRDARRNKERTYPELLRDRRCRLVVFGIEVGGRWSDEAATFLRLLAHTKARQTPPLPHQRPDPPLERHAHACGHACLCSIPPWPTKTYLAATTSKATPLPSVRSSLGSPAPPTTPDFQPPPKETGLDLALSSAHPGAAGI